MGSALPLLGLPSKADMYAAALEGLVQVNGLILGKNPELPPLYDSGAVYAARPHNTWRRADQINGEGWGDCEGLSAWRVAELREGEDPGSRVGIYHTGPQKYHAIVIRGDDAIEDPSVALGMRWRPGMPTTRAEMNMINGRWPQRSGGHSIVIGSVEEWDDPAAVSTTLVPHPDGGVAAQIKIPLADGRAIVATTSPSVDKAVATAKAANLLADTAANIAKNPLLLANLNPYTAAAVQIYNNPEVKKGLKRLGQGAKKLLHKFW